MKKKSSKSKQQLIEEKLQSPVEVGERVYVLGKNCNGIRAENTYSFIVKEIIDNLTFLGENDEGSRKPSSIELKFSDIVERWVYDIGANPFSKSNRNVRFVAYNLQSILFKLGLNDGDGEREEKYHTKNGTLIKNCNWNPHVVNAKGEKEYYQRDFVWTVADKQLLLESIYNGIDCGKILVREHSYGQNEKKSLEGETNLSFYDIIDGKQRLNAIHEFIKGSYPDSHGNFYSDLSDRSQRMLTDNQLFVYGEMSEETTDSDVIEQFLKLNFTGVPQSPEHIEFVKSIHNKL